MWTECDTLKLKHESTSSLSSLLFMKSSPVHSSPDLQLHYSVFFSSTALHVHVHYSLRSFDSSVLFFFSPLLSSSSWFISHRVYFPIRALYYKAFIIFFLFSYFFILIIVSVLTPLDSYYAMTSVITITQCIHKVQCIFYFQIEKYERREIFLFLCLVSLNNRTLSFVRSILHYHITECDLHRHL